jgi:hypothetical protein
MQNPNYNIGNRTRDLPACRAVPQPTAPPRVPIKTLAAFQWQTARSFLKSSVNYRKAVKRLSAMDGRRPSLYQLSVM